MAEIFKYKNSVLNAMINEITKSPQETLVVFDLDSTLFDVTPRIQQIIHDYVAHPEHQSLFPESLKKLKNVVLLPTDWGFDKSFQRHGLTAEPEAFHQNLYNYWHKQFFTNEYLHFDAPYEGAVDFVNRVYDAGTNIVYLTGRDIERMGPGSTEVLLKWNFPLDDKKARLVLKPQKEMDDARFKSDWFNDKKNQYKKIYFVENEPTNIHLVLKEHPLVDIIYFDSTHSGKNEPPWHLPTIQDYL